MTVNDKKYWNTRFKKNWQLFEGPNQTKFFANLLTNNIPKWLIDKIIKKKYSFCDAGCAEGDSTVLISQLFPKINISGFDFSETAISLAKSKYKNINFFVDDVTNFKKKFDVIYCSNTLEHLPNPSKVLIHLLKQTNKHLIIQIPFQEKKLFKEHINRFDYKDLPLKINDFYLTFCRVKDTSIKHSRFWPGKQLIAVYSNTSDIDKNINFNPSISDQDYDEIKNTNNVEYQNLDKITELKYLTEISKLNQELIDKGLEINNYFLILNKIYHSKTWRLLGIFKKTTNKVKIIIKRFIPIVLRKKIKSIIESKLISFGVDNQIANIVLENWRNWNYDKRSDTSLDIINFSVIAWDFRFQRPQQLAKEMGRLNHRVFYIKNEFMPFNNSKTYFAPIKVEEKSKNVYEITLSATRNLFIYNETPTIKDKQIIIASIRNLLNQAQISAPIAKFDHPFWASIINELSMPTIYDCMDNHQGFAENGNHLEKLEKLLFKNSNINLVTSKYLQNIAIDNKANNVELIQNAGDFEHFAKALKPIKNVPEDISNIPHPIIGYYGALAEWFDTDILNSIAISHSDKSIVLIGAVTNQKIEKLAAKYKNIYLLGEKTYQELPNYLSQFDVCTIPFILNDLIKATHPVKIFEYLAAGKPIVATKMPEIIDMEEIYFSAPKEFSNNITKALDNKNINIANRQSVAKIHTWQKKSLDLIAVINKNLFPKVSIILLSYNNSEMVRNTINSILTRSFYPNFELIIVDNKSDEATIDVLNSFRGNKNVKLILNIENYGFAKGNNIGLAAATGEYLILINNDVLVTPGWINRLLYHIQKENIGLVGPVTNSIGNEAKIDIQYNSFEIKDLENKARLYTSSHWSNTIELKDIAAFCWIMSRKIYQELGGLDERFGRGFFEDDDYCRAVITSGKKILCADDVFIHHFGGTSFKKINTEEYQKLFNDNKEKFENKWHTSWIPHQYRK